MKDIKDLPRDIAETSKTVGIQETEKNRSGSFFHLDEKTLFTNILEGYKDKVEMLDINDALGKYDWLSEYDWKLVDPEKDEYTKSVKEESSGGYFIRIKENQKIPVPLQSCMFISHEGYEQKVHNIIIAEPGSEAQIITGCAVSPGAGSARHLGVSEFYVKEGASLTFTMIHNWNRDTLVRPRSATLVEDNATFSSNYIILKPVKDLQTYPHTICRGTNSVARISSLLHAEKDSLMDVGGSVSLEGTGSSAEIISRAITKDDSTIIARGKIEGENPTVKGHLECRGLLLGKDSRIIAIPELSAKGEGAEISHEAAVGKIAEREILYLMSRGLTRDDATALIIRGFLDTKILHLPTELERIITEMTGKVAEGL